MFYNGMPASEFAAILTWVVLAVGMILGTVMATATAVVMRMDADNTSSAAYAFVWTLTLFTSFTATLGLSRG